MGEIVLTSEQKAVVDNRGGTLLVSAAAGSGKTKVLIDRVMKKVCTEGCNVDDFLMITFTKAAATELRAKLITQLSELLAGDPANHHLQKQMNRVYLAQISTVHAFCKTLLRDYAHELELPADFRICDDQERLTLQRRAMTICLEQSYSREQTQPEILAATNMLGIGRDDTRLEDLILKLYDNLRNYKDPKARAAELYDSLNCEAMTDAGRTIWGMYLLEETRYWAAGMAEQFRLLLDQAIVEEVDPYVPTLREDVSLLRELSKLDSWEAIRDFDVCFGDLSGKRCKADPECRKAIQKKRNKLKEKVFAKLDLFSLSSEEILADIRLNAPALTGLLQLTERFAALFAEEKRHRHVLDYGDLEHETLRLLYGKGAVPTRAAREISARYVDIMVDEYQDTNAVQDAIFYAISRNGENLFFVGDIKQSIYRFRMADPTIFQEKYRNYSFYKEAAPGEPRKILLSDNFRSHPAILEAANAVFRLTMSDRVGGLPYTDAEALRPHRVPEDMGSAPVELHCVSIPSRSDFSRTEVEAEFVAQRIETMLRDGELIPDGKKGLRRICQGDVVILLRAMRNKSEIYMEALRRHNIRGICADNNIFDAEEIQVLVSLLQVLDNPRQDIPLLTVLLSPLFRFPTGRLAELRGKDREGDIYTLLSSAKEAGGVMEEISVLRDLSQELSLRALMDEIDVRLNYRCIYGSMENGLQRIRNLERFHTIVDGFEGSGRYGLSGFLKYLELIKERPPGGELSGEVDAVRLMSSHSSKGLEFPVVFLPDLGKQINFRDSSAPVITDQKLGIAANVYHDDLRLTYSTMPKIAIGDHNRAETVSEEMRILYVAMTRARDRMILVCCSPKMESKLTGLAQSLTIPLVPGVSDSVASAGDWVLMTALTRTESGQLFAAAGNPGLGSVSQHPWRVCLHQATALFAADTVAPETEQKEASVPAPAYLVQAYSREAATQTPAKLTATQMKQSDTADGRPKISLRKAGFEKGSRVLSGTERGIAIHLAMQYLDFSRCDTAEQLQQELQRLTRKRFLTYEQMQAVSVEKLQRFFRSALFQRIRQAKKVVREFKFSLLEDAAYYDPALQGEQILLQGVTDCCIVEEDGLVILDFKSDRVSPGGEALRAEFYRGQLDAYSRALGRIFDLPVKERILYFFATDTAYTL